MTSNMNSKYGYNKLMKISKIILNVCRYTYKNTNEFNFLFKSIIIL